MRKIFVSGAAVLALLMNSPQVSADDDIVIFGGEFEDEVASPAPKKTAKPTSTKSTKPASAKNSPSKEKPAPVEVATREPAAPASEHTVIKPRIENQKPSAPSNEVSDKDRVVASAEKPTQEPKPVKEPAKVQPSVEVNPPIETDRPFNPPTALPDDNERVVEPVVIVPPPVQPVQPVQEPLPQSNVQEPPVVTERPTPRRTSPQPQQELKVLKPRFIKLAVDDTYTYYLDKTSVKWKKMPYSTSEYIADVWVRMIERQPKPLEDDMVSYGADNFNAEIALAREQGYQYAPEDLQVLRSQAYVLEHYYLRPKTEQIQFLCELEVFGRPQNTINERSYDYKNWESLVPGSVESVIYAATIKIIGKSKSSERGHMTFFDMLDEYARIALN